MTKSRKKDKKRTNLRNKGYVWEIVPKLWSTHDKRGLAQQQEQGARW